MIRNRKHDLTRTARSAKPTASFRVLLPCCALAFVLGGCASSPSTSGFRTTELTSATTAAPAPAEGSAPKVGKAERSFELDDESDDNVAPKRPTTSRRSGNFGNWK